MPEQNQAQTVDAQTSLTHFSTPSPRSASVGPSSVPVLQAAQSAEEKEDELSQSQALQLDHRLERVHALMHARAAEARGEAQSQSLSLDDCHGPNHSHGHGAACTHAKLPMGPIRQ